MSQIFDASDFEGGADDELPLEKKEEQAAPPGSYKVPDNYEDESLRGLSADDLIKQVRTLRDTSNTALNTIRQLQNAQQEAASRNAPKAPDPTQFALTQEDLLGSDVNTVNAKINQMVQASVAPLFMDTYKNQSQQMYLIARGDKARMPHFEDYEPEILAIAQHRPLTETANYQTWQDIHNRVAQQHQAEIIEKEVRTRLASLSQNGQQPMNTTRGRSGGGSPASPEIDAEQMVIARKLGLGRDFSMEDLKRHLPQDN